MAWPLNSIFNWEEEVHQLAEYPNIKMFFIKKMTASEPQNDLIALDDNTGIKWISSDDATYVSRISAICTLTAKYMADTMGKNKVNHFIILIRLITISCQHASKIFTDIWINSSSMGWN